MKSFTKSGGVPDHSNKRGFSWTGDGCRQEVNNVFGEETIQIISADSSS